MRSPLPKPLHRLCGRPMLLHVLDALAELPIERVVVVVGYRAARYQGSRVRGAGRAASRVRRAGRPARYRRRHRGRTDRLPRRRRSRRRRPWSCPGTRRSCVRRRSPRSCARTVSRTPRRPLLTARIDDPAGYGRVVVRKDGGVREIVEHADATDEEREIDEVATSIYCFRHGVLAPALRRLVAEQRPGRVLPDRRRSRSSHDAGYRWCTMVAGDPIEAAGVNDRAQLAAAEAELRERINERWMRRGVTMIDPSATYIDVSRRDRRGRDAAARRGARGPDDASARGRHRPGVLDSSTARSAPGATSSRRPRRTR